jgi:hypothetical protein
LPGRFSHWIEILALLAVVTGDAVAFQQVVAVAMPDATTLFTWGLIIALSAAATATMHLAGVSARRRQVDAHDPGPLWSWCLVLCWLFLGGTALWVRLAHAEAQGTPAPAGGVFGTAPAVGAATNIPMAALLLGLYLVGGITAYGIGYMVHNPARTAYLRARREYVRAGRAYRRALWLRERAVARTARPSAGLLSERLHVTLTPSARPPRARPDAPDATPAPELIRTRASDALTASRELAIRGARAQAEQLREVARHRLAAALAEPARTTGVFDGHPKRGAGPAVDVIQGGPS